MDPNHTGPLEYGHGQDGDSSLPRRRPPRESLPSDFGQHAPGPARTAQLVSGDFLLTVNPVDGSEIEPCPPAQRPGRPAKRTGGERAEVERAARPPVPPGLAQPGLPLVARQDEREKLVRLLARGRSVRLTGPPGSGRTRLLEVVAEDCADLAPDGVVRLNGLHRSAEDLLYDLFHAVHHAPLYRPDRDELAAAVRAVGAVVVIDDLEFGGAALDELLVATPECAFLLAAAPDVADPSFDAGVEEVALSGLERADCLDLLEHAAGRRLSEEEVNWAGDLWFESEGLPLRFVQAGALLRQRDRLRADAGAVDEHGVFEDIRPDEAPSDAPADDDVPLPPLGEAAAPAPLLASRLSASARATLRLAVALDGEVPHHAHLPALVGDTHADAALGELAACGLISPAGSRCRLAAGVPAQLEAAGYGDEAEEQIRTAAQHYAWWTGHPSVTPERVCAEADAVLAALTALLPLTTATTEEEPGLAVQLARTAGPAFASGLRFGAWEKALRAGAEAARIAGDVGEQAYFHHELGIHALCSGQLDRSRAELETSVGLRGAVADKRGTVAGRRALALVADRSGTPLSLMATEEDLPGVRAEEPASPPRGVPTAFPRLQRPADTSFGTGRTVPPPPSPQHSVQESVPPLSEPPATSRGAGLKNLAKRNLVAAGAGALLVAVLGTVVTLGATSDDDAGTPSENVGVNPSSGQDFDGGLGVDPAAGNDGDTGEATGRPSGPGTESAPGTTGDTTPTAGESEEPSDERTGTETPDDPSGTPSHSQSQQPSTTPDETASSQSQEPTDEEDQEEDPPASEDSSGPEDTDSGTPTDTEPSDGSETETQAGGSPSSTPLETGTSASAPQSGGPGTSSGSPVM